MAGRISRGWNIAKQSAGVIRKDPELLVFPIFSAIACLLVIASFIMPIFAVPELSAWFTAAMNAPENDPVRQQANMVAAIAGFAFYVVNYFVIIFFNTALAACAIKRFQGGDPTLGYGLKAACSRLPQIMAWTMVAATVGIVLRMVSERSQILGKIVVAIIGTAWTIATYFVVPTLAVEGLGPIKALKRSSSLLSQAWGEGLVGNLGLTLLNFLLLLPFLAMLLLAGILGANSAALGMTMLGISAVYIIVMIAASSAMKQVFIAGLYMYATEKKVPAGFSVEAFEGAFRKK